MDYNYYSLHFHMKSGGVKIVIENLMKEFTKFSSNSFTLIESGVQFSYTPCCSINHIEIPEFNYSDRKFFSYDELLLEAEKLSLVLESKLDFSKKCVVHMHNANLFKNSYVPTALKLLSEKHLDNLLMIYQVHDFAEDNRLDRLELMQNCTGKFDSELAGSLAYPVTKNSIYLTINSRDKRLLKRIGIPLERILVFPNAVNTEFFSSEVVKDDRLLDLISDYAKKNNYVFSKGRKNIIYPVKIIKRKNVLEAILLLKVMNMISDEYQLLITLDASSSDDVLISDKIKDYIRSNKLPVVIGLGFEIISPNENRKEVDGKIIEYTIPDLFSHASCILTTSILEGFGFAFVEGWLTGKPVLGRRIELVMEDFEREGIKFPGFYSSVPTSDGDFGFLEFSEQLELLDSSDFLESLKDSEVIRNLLNAIDNFDSEVLVNNKEVILSKYSLEGNFSYLESLISVGFELSKHDVDVKIDNFPLIKYFSVKDVKYVVITDIDRTFVDDSYSFNDSLGVFEKLRSFNVPVCFCTSKAFYEVDYFFKKLNYVAPFISENGSAIYVPKNYFSFDVKKFDFRNKFLNLVEIEDYFVIELNVSHSETYAVLKKIQGSLPFETHIYSDYSVEELGAIVGLAPEMANLSKKKFYADGMLLEDFSETDLLNFKTLVEEEGFSAKIGGRFVGINKGCDKGQATKILLELFEEEFSRVESFGLGDSPNDFSFLDVVDYPYLVLRPDGSVASDIFPCSETIGPKGWSEVLKKNLLSKF